MYTSEQVINTEEFNKYLPSLDPKVNYWLFRANGGQYYDDFNAGNYIGIGWNQESLSIVKGFQNNREELKAHIFKNYPKEKQPGSTASQLLKFIFDLKENDLVLVPSENSERYLIGRIKGEAYLEDNSDLLDENRHCPYTKRRPVTWIGVINRSKADTSLYKLVYAGHTMSNANEYKPFINRALFDSYIENDEMHSTFLVTQEKDIDMYEFSKFQYNFSEMYRTFFPKEKLVSKTNVQSMGPVEIIGIFTGIAFASGLLFFFLKPYIKSIHLKVGVNGADFKVVKDDPQTNKWHIEKEQRQLHLEEIAAADEHDKKLLKNIEKAQKLSKNAGDSMDELGIKFSDEFQTAIKKMNQQDDPSKK
ncbi:restriction endonuclease [Lactiplantibacillus mudanjiangensis]|uniref:Uncharacterized protein n=1 Tax=Lactiplantibacillus mudanjiangensis TaxID=1296538 RepID=A0A660E5T8_9LACO|nr:hypothetical protein [Lactiplantibacillus mudanjiangensis]VDG24191.1 hypothetical protein [Lactobacillus plantarum subsp. plantarum] [Lactiplantibacillus mudanjiangensis]VDG30169.1 hypothetical protein [Lactobacillus plantarum subsp. plantarum] [Lactiplantibacillus mudanjiangensis]